MRNCKKLLITLLLIFVSVISVGNFTPKAFAEQESKVETQMFLPSTYFEYYALNEPIDICADEENIYIAEKTAIVIFNHATQLYTRIDCTLLLPSISWNITKIDCYNGHIFIFNDLKIYYISATDTSKITYSGLTSAYYFHISGNRIYTHSNSHTYSWIISYENNEFTFGSYSTSSSEYQPNLIYNNISGIAFAYSPVSSYLFYFTSSDCSKVSAENPSATTVFTQSTQYCEFYNGNLYFIENNCLYEYNESLSVAPLKLFDANNNQNDIKGFCIQEGKVLVVNTSKNEIWEFDLSTASFTDKYVATYKVAKNRLTENVIDLVISGEYLFTLQKESLSRFALDQTSCQTVTFPSDFSLTEFDPKHISVIGEDVLLSNGKQIKAFKITQTEESLTATELSFSTIGTWEENNICGLFAFDGSFYILKNRTIENLSYAVIYKLFTTSSGYEVNNDQYVWKKEGTGINFTINSFGELYLIATENNLGKRITCYDLINKTTTSLTTPIADGVTKIISDFENVFVLNESTILNITTNQPFTINKSSNFNAVDNPVSFTVDLSSGKTYLLYKGYILQTSSLPLKTPNTYSIPVGYNQYTDNIQVVTVSEGAKLFTVEDDGDLFKYQNVISANNSQYLLICDLSEDFCLIGHEENSYLARKQDLTEQTLTTFTPTFTSGYYVTKAGKYTQPMLNLTFKQTDVTAYEQVSIVRGIIINDIPFYEILFNDNSRGYIQQSFIVEHISENATKENYYLANCNKTSVYSADGKTIIGSIEQGKIKIYGKENGMYKISFNDKIGYIKPSALITEKNKSVRNSLVIMIVATSFTITAIYLLVRYNRKFNI